MFYKQTKMLANWSQYLSNENINKIESFVNDSINGIKRHKIMTFYGTGNNGKTTLIKEIINIIGQHKCVNIHKVYNADFNADPNMFYCYELNDNADILLLKSVNSGIVIKKNGLSLGQIINLHGNVLVETNTLNGTVVDILEDLEVIHFTHTF